MPAPRDVGLPTNILQSLTVTYAGAVAQTPGVLMGWDGNLAIAPATSIMGVTRDDAATGKQVSVATAGLVEGIAGGAIAIGQPIGADTLGRCIVAAAGSQIIGRATTATTALGQRVQFFITREGTT